MHFAARLLYLWNGAHACGFENALVLAPFWGCKGSESKMRAERVHR